MGPVLPCRPYGLGSWAAVLVVPAVVALVLALVG
jgi:hypothetical protein